MRRNLLLAGVVGFGVVLVLVVGFAVDRGGTQVDDRVDGLASPGVARDQCLGWEKWGFSDDGSQLEARESLPTLLPLIDGVVAIARVEVLCEPRRHWPRLHILDGSVLMGPDLRPLYRITARDEEIFRSLDHNERHYGLVVDLDATLNPITPFLVGPVLVFDDGGGFLRVADGIPIREMETHLAALARVLESTEEEAFIELVSAVDDAERFAELVAIARG